LRLQCVVLLLLTAAAQAQQVKLPPAVHTRLQNGLHLVLMEYRKSPVLAVRMEFPGGTAAETAGPAGAAGITAAMLKSGTLGRTGPELSEQFEYLGSAPSITAQPDRIEIALTLLKTHADAGLKLLAEMVRESQYPAQEFERRRRLAVSALQSLADEPAALNARVADEVAYSGHPYGALPTTESLKALTREDILQYARRVIAPNRAVLVLVGDFSTAELAAKAKALFADWTAAPQPVAQPPGVTLQPRRVVVIDKPDAEQTNAVWIRAGIPRNHPLYLPCEVADAALGGGFTSRLVEEVRVNRSLTYGIRSGFTMLTTGGTFSVRTFTKVETTADLIQVTERVLRDTARKGVTAKELAKVKGYMAGQFAIHLQTPEGIAASLADGVINNLPDNEISTWLQRLNAVTPAQVNAAAAQFFNPAKLSLVLTCPVQKTAAVLRQLGAEKPRPASEVAR
jgi:zinc protease